MSIIVHKAIAPELMADSSVTNRKFCDLFIRDQLGQKLQGSFKLPESCESSSAPLTTIFFSLSIFFLPIQV